MKQRSIYDTSVWARKYRHDFEALQLSQEQVGLMWEEFCKVNADGGVARGGLGNRPAVATPINDKIIRTARTAQTGPNQRGFCSLEN